ncbi:uncharacterized protein LOC125946583 [Dermacentor silvarum]|uniref:uncharacterized protein LOC119435842 n=2 Tax=Dermacentor silvarum TaxID=543639 RepID=UPI002101BA47|nr:uncharacterized protein LOC119435842 [Dermacentor silvarum]XP_049526031.1 uncharacterized protein LOC125946583 [Dermacentor silvarum]
MGADRQTPAMAAARIQRWALLLGAYKYKLMFKPGKLMLNSDALSRLPQMLQAPEPAVEECDDMVLAIDGWDHPAVSRQELKALTAADEMLSSVCRKQTEHRRKPTDDTTWSFAPGDTIYVRNYGVGDKWTPGKVKSTTGARLVTVQTDEGVVRRHTDQVRKRSADTSGTPSAEPQDDPMPTEERALDSSTTSDGSEAPPQLRRSTRTKKPVERYGY